MNLAHKPENEKWPSGKQIGRVASDSVKTIYKPLSYVRLMRH